MTDPTQAQQELTVRSILYLEALAHFHMAYLEVHGTLPYAEDRSFEARQQVREHAPHHIPGINDRFDAVHQKQLALTARKENA